MIWSLPKRVFTKGQTLTKIDELVVIDFPSANHTAQLTILKRPS